MTSDIDPHPRIDQPPGMDDATRPDAGQARTDTAVRQTVQQLLHDGQLEAVDKPNLYRNVLQYREDIARALEPLDLELHIDDIRGLAFLAVAGAGPEDDWSHPLVLRRRMNLEQSLLVAILRQQFIAHEVETGVGAEGARVVIDELLPHLQVYLGDMGSDAQERKRVLNLLEQLRGHGMVSEVDEHERVLIRPIIAHLANPENLAGLIEALRNMAAENDTPAANQADAIDGGAHDGESNHGA